MPRNGARRRCPRRWTEAGGWRLACDGGRGIKQIKTEAMMKKICSEGSHALVQNWFCLPLVNAALSCLSDSPAPRASVLPPLSVQRPERFSAPSCPSLSRTSTTTMHKFTGRQGHNLQDQRQHEDNTARLRADRGTSFGSSSSPRIVPPLS